MKESEKGCIVSEIELRRRTGASLWAVVDDEDLEMLSGYRWTANVQEYVTYAQATVRTASGDRSTVQMHNIVLGMKFVVSDDLQRGEPSVV